MAFLWYICYFCSGEGRLEIGSNEIILKNEPSYNKKNLSCPICKGRGELAVKFPVQNSLNEDRRGYL